MLKKRLMMIAVWKPKINHFRENRKIECCREISRMKKKKKEQIDYLMCLIIWKQDIIILKRSVRAFGEKNRKKSTES